MRYIGYGLAIIAAVLTIAFATGYLSASGRHRFTRRDHRHNECL